MVHWHGGGAKAFREGRICVDMKPLNEYVMRVLSTSSSLAPLSDSQILLNWMQMQDVGKSLS